MKGCVVTLLSLWVMPLTVIASQDYLLAPDGKHTPFDGDIRSIPRGVIEKGSEESPGVFLDPTDFQLRWNDTGTHYTFAFNTGDTMALWMAPLGRAIVKKILIYNMDFTGEFCFFLHDALYDGEVTSSACADRNGWVGFWAHVEEGDTVDSDPGESEFWLPGDNECFNDPPMGEELWPALGMGCYLLPLDGESHGTWHEVDLGIILGNPDTLENPFFIDAGVTKTDPDSWGIGAWDDVEIPYHALKFYEEIGPSGNPGWHVRSFGWDVYAVVEYVEDIPPFVEDVTVLHTTLSTEPREVKAKIWDANPSGDQAGVTEAWLHWETSSEADSGEMVFQGDSLYSGSIPGFVPGTEITYWVKAKDVMGNWSRYGRRISYEIFEPKELTLFINNTRYPNWIHYYYLLGLDIGGLDGLPHDVWDVRWGPVTFELLQNYRVAIEAQGGGPKGCSSGLDRWLDEGNRHFLISGDQWLGKCYYGWPGSCGGGVVEIPQGDFLRDYMGITAYYPDINNCDEGDSTGVSRLLPIEDNPISGHLYDFLGDSLVLNYDPYYEIGAGNRLDGIGVEERSHTLFYGISGVLDSVGDPAGSDTFPVAVFTRLPNGSETAFFAFDVLSLNTMAVDIDLLPDGGYYWIGIRYISPIPQTLWCFTWGCFGSGSTSSQPTFPSVMSLQHPFPNPFNPETTVGFSLPRSGRVTLKVYDLLGREVQTLLNGRLEAGHHTIQWNAMNVPSGIYVIRMEAEGTSPSSGQGFTQVRKVTVLR